MTSVIHPQKLKQGDKVMVIAPAGFAPKSEVAEAKKVLEEIGLKVKLHPIVDEQHFYFSGTDEQRAHAINDAFADAEIKAIFCTRGGYGCPRIKDLINYELIKSNPKFFIGSSDVTTLLHTIYNRTGLVTYHGPMLHTFAKSNSQITTDHLKNILFGVKDNFVIKNSAETPLEVINTGYVKAKLTGGNISLLQGLIGTADDFDTQGKILFLEDIDMVKYQLERSLLHLKDAGKFKNISALLFDWTVNLKDNTNLTFDKEELDIFKEITSARGLDIPAVAGFPCGHWGKMLTLPIGAEAEILIEKDKVQVNI